ncbi:6-phosphofructokinase [Clostridium akagii]|uniref:6-phosphofructokinase n=1 Tax=Clostridium akagii TaxID=91623 RepID=UPI0005648492|nr:6-phosphofructokinase [Clostridium akagii]
MIKGNCLLAESGGPTSVINASAYGIIKEFLSLDSNFTVYAGIYGIKGILEKNIIDVKGLDIESIESLKYMPSVAFGSCRYKLEDFKDNDKDYKKLIDIFERFNIKYFMYIGGNDSMDAAYKISKYCENIGYEMNTIGVPKTIDNDLVGTDHCPGFGSTAKYVSNVAMELWLDNNTYDKESIMIMEVMGRDAGWIAASTGILQKSGIEINKLIYLPEIPFNEIEFLRDVKNSLKNNNKLLIVTSEGLKDGNGEYINVDNNCYQSDDFEHVQLGGIGRYLQQCLKNNVTNNVKLTEVGVIQRCAIHCASKTDIEEAEMVGRASIKYAIDGYSGYMTALYRVVGSKYSCNTKLIKLHKVRNKVKNVPINWLKGHGQVEDELINYIEPLILGEVNSYGTNGLINCNNISIFRKKRF